MSHSLKNGNIEIIVSFPDSLPPPSREFISQKICSKLQNELDIFLDELWRNNIKIRFIGKIIEDDNDIPIIKNPLPEFVEKLIQTEMKLEPPQHIKVKKNPPKQKRNWMTFWGMFGNPFLDNPLTYKSEYFIESKQIERIFSEIETLVQVKQGAVRLIVGERGLGKTTIFQLIEGKFQSEVSVHIIDVADIVVGVNNSNELFHMLFTTLTSPTCE